MALIIDSTFKYVDTNPLDGLLEKEELSRAFENLDANGKPFKSLINLSYIGSVSLEGQLPKCPM